MINRLLFKLLLFISKLPKLVIFGLLAVIFIGPFIGIIGAKSYQLLWDRDSARGAIGIKAGAFGETYKIPEYLDQGWSEADSLWFYNTTQGSGLLPYDFFLVLEQQDYEAKKGKDKNSNKVKCKRNLKQEDVAWFLCDQNIDRFRYLPQKDTPFNPDALPVGFVKGSYLGKD